ncbi:universal stress protein [Halorhodospira halophila]|uniref:UspA domain protein n=1 Tax=Halorhodospira halophila (strain DSM 244 / SL1) TaxID=349124 RepID=A1WWW9_HALHL|nr:universal stress protein [Halorhodospira halophila]ABM62181.1 UspA domain protein [Halorhodospira halophila SL1]MBK1729509.1 universal stress protein [Halorhodospira halophila]
MHKILYATDLSERTEAAAQRSVELARRHSAELRAVHVIEADLEEETLRLLFREQGAGAQQATRELEQAGEARMTEQLTAIAGDGAAPSWTVGCRWGRGASEIAAEARDWGADLVAIGAHGRRVVRDLFLGATAERLTHELSAPILVVKRPPRGAYQRVLVAVDGSPRSRRAVEMAARLAPDARLHLLSVHDTTPLERIYGAGEGAAQELQAALQAGREQTAEELSRLVAELPMRDRIAHYEARSGNPATVIDQVAGEADIDLVAMGTRGLSRWQGALLGSVARRVAHESERDLLLTSGEG